MLRIAPTLIFILLLIPQPVSAIQDDDIELRLIEAEDPIVQQQGEWALVEDTENARGDGYLISSGEPDDELGLLFEGTRIEVIYLTGPDYGTFHIEVDNETVQTIDTKSETAQFNVRAIVNGLEPGFHIIRVIADRGAIAVDCFQIIPSDEVAISEIISNRHIVDEQGMLSLASQQGVLSVVAGFEVPPGFTLPRRLEDDELLEKQNANIQLVANTLLIELEGYIVEAVFQSTLFPSIDLNVDRAALEVLLDIPYVTFLRREYYGIIE